MIVCGLPGVGKTTLAKEMAPLLNAVVLSTDKIRKQLIKEPTYSRRERRLVYDVLLLIAKYLHDAGTNCILDATFNKQKSRNQVKKTFGLKENQLPIVECVCPEKVVISRLHERKLDYSDADFCVYKKMQKIFESVKGFHIVVDTRNPVKKNAEFVVKKIKERI